MNTPQSYLDSSPTCRGSVPLRAFTGSALLLLCITPGCSQPELGRQAYTLAVSLDQLFEKRDEVQLARAGELIASELASGVISNAEAAVLTDLVSRAEAGDWDRARRDTRKLLAAQSDW